MFLSLLLCTLSAEAEFNSVAQHFNACLESQIDDCYAPATYECTHAIPLEEIKEYRDKVWDLWAEANNTFTYVDKKEEAPRAKMMPFGLYFSYVIPQSLEPYIAEPGEPDKYEGPNAQMVYRFGYKGSKNAGPYPLFILTHGSGTVSEEQKSIYQVAINNNDAPCVYFVPRIPNGVYGYYRWYHRSKQWVWEKLLRQMFLRSDIDHDRMYFTGISEGAYGSQLLASFYADYFAGFGPMAGGGPLIYSPCENLRNTYFNLTTGSLDTNYKRNELTALAGEYLDRLQDDDPEGYFHKVTVLPGVTHNTTPYHYTTPDLLQHSRPHNPKRVRWENFRLDGRYRYGFHNIRVYERSEPEGSDDYTRTYYELDIDGNNVDLRVSITDYVVTETFTDYGATLPIRFSRATVPATKGRLKIYLNEELLDLENEVVLTVNGHELFRGFVQPNLADMVNSCAEYYDPTRIFCASLDVDLEQMSVHPPVSGIHDLTAESDGDNTTVEYYNLQGINIDRPTAPGMYLIRQGSKTTKTVIR